MQEDQIYGASFIIQAALVDDILPPVLGTPFGPIDFEIIGQTFNLLNQSYWNGFIARIRHHRNFSREENWCFSFQQE